MKDTPTVAAIIPTFVNSPYLVEAIESVLAQTYAPIELLVVDDASPDDIASAVRAYPGVRLLRNPTRLGGPATRNRAVEATTAAYLAFLDYDDLWLPAKIEAQMAMFAADPALDIALTMVEQFFSPEQKDKLELKYRMPSGSLPGYLPSAMLVRREALNAIGGFVSESQAIDTLSFFDQAFDGDLKIAVHPDVLARRRIHLHNFSNVYKDLRSLYPRLLKARIDKQRRRAAESRGPDAN